MTTFLIIPLLWIYDGIHCAYLTVNIWDDSSPQKDIYVNINKITLLITSRNGMTRKYCTNRIGSNVLFELGTGLINSLAFMDFWQCVMVSCFGSDYWTILGRMAESGVLMPLFLTRTDCWTNSRVSITHVQVILQMSYLHMLSKSNWYVALVNPIVLIVGPCKGYKTRVLHVQPLVVTANYTSNRTSRTMGLLPDI